MRNFRELRDSQREAYENLFNIRLKHLIESKSCNIGTAYRLECRMFPVDRKFPVTEDGTDYYPIRAEFVLHSTLNEGSVSFYVDLLKMPVLYELGFKIGGNYMQMLEEYERASGWSLSVERRNNREFPTVTAKVLGAYGKTFSFVYDQRRIAIVDFSGLRSNAGKSGATIEVSTFLRALSGLSSYELMGMFGQDNPFVIAAFDGNPRAVVSHGRLGTNSDCVAALAGALLGSDKAGSLSTVKMKQKEIQKQLFSANYLNLGESNLKRFNSLQSYKQRAKGALLAEDINVCGTILKRGIVLTGDLLEQIDSVPVDSLKITKNGKIYDLKKFSGLTFRALGARLMEDVPEAGLSRGKKLDLDDLRVLNDSGVSDIKVGMNGHGTVDLHRRVSAASLELEDIYTVFSMWMDNLNGLGIYDKPFELTNRVGVSFDDLACNFVNRGLMSVIHAIKERAAIIGEEEILASVVSDFGKDINTDAFIERVKSSKDGGGEISEMCNIVSYISKSNKVFTEINPDNITPDMVAVQDLQEGRLDPFDIPESNRIGSVHNKTVLSDTDESGDFLAPYLPVKNGEVVSDTPVYLSAIDEIGKCIASWDETFVDKDGNKKSTVQVKCDGDIITVPVDKVAYKKYSNLQTLSVPHSMITFPGHSNAKRITMGCNQIKQAIWNINSQRPFVGTGSESIVDFGTYTGEYVLKEYYEGYVGVAPELGKYKDRVMGSTLVLKGITSAEGGRTLEFEVSAVIGINEETGADFDYTAMLQIPYMLRNFQQSFFSYRLNHVSGRVYHPEDVIAYSTGYSIEKKERVDLVDYGAFSVDRKCFDKGLALGQNLLVGYKTAKSSTIDDAILISDSLIYSEKMTHMRAVLIQDELKGNASSVERFGKKSAKQKNFDNRGLPTIGSYLKPGDKCISKLVTKGGKTNARYVHLSPYEEGQVISAEIIQKSGKTVAQVLLASRSTIEPGDKMAGRHGNKGVVAQILPEEQMPFDPETGRTLDICLNPLGVPSRGNVSQLLEVALGMCRLADGKNSYVSPYHEDDLKFVKEQVKEFNVHPLMMVDGRTGKMFKRPINVGVIYMYKLQQTAISGIHAIGLEAPVDPAFLQPKHGAKMEGGQSFGEMENWCLHGIGANLILRDFYGFQSDDVRGREEAKDLLSLPGGQFMNIDSRNHNDAVLQSMLRSLGVTLVTEGDAYSLVPMTDSRIRALNAFPVTGESDLHSPAIFGKDDTLIDKEEAKGKWGWIDLGAEIIHPIWLKKNSFGFLFSMDVNSSTKAPTTLTDTLIAGILNEELKIMHISGNLYVVYAVNYTGKYYDLSELDDDGLDRCMSGMPALVYMYRHCDVESVYLKMQEGLEKRIERAEERGKEYDYRSKSHLSTIKRIATLREFIESGQSLSDYVISSFPVMPVSFRPDIHLSKKSNSVADFDQLYIRIIRAARDVKNSGSAGQIKALYDRVCDFTGINGTEKGSKYRSALSYFTGSGTANDHGKLRSAVQSKRIFCSGRATITPADYRISPLQLGVPATMLVKMGSLQLSAYFKTKIKVESAYISNRSWDDLFLTLALGDRRKFFRIYLHSKAMFNEQFDMMPDVAFHKMREWIVNFFEGKDGCIRQVVASGRQPSLHKYSIRAFYPVVLWSRAIQINSLVCKGYNADFDGDKMWVTLLQSQDAREEALEKITPGSDMINPKNSSVMLEHTQDISLGCYVATMLKDNSVHCTQTVEDVIFYDSLTLLQHDVFAGVIEPWQLVSYTQSIDEESRCYLSTAGRVLFNAQLDDGGFTDREFSNPLGIEGIDCSRYRDLAYDALITCGKGGSGEIRYYSLQDICKELYLDRQSECIGIYYDIEIFGFQFSDMYGVSIGIDDMEIESGKEEILAEAAEKKLLIERDYQDGLISEGDKRDAVISLYTNDEFGANPRIEKNLIDNLDRNNNLFIMMDSGARGNKTQIMHMCGAIGILEKSKTESMEDSVVTNYYEGLSDLDVHMTSYSARTGVAASQRETRNAGYATRKVIYMTDGMKVVANDCGKKDWWYDSIWDDRIDSLSVFRPSKTWFDLNMLGREVDGVVIGEADFKHYAEDGFNRLCFSDGAEPHEYVADPYILVGSRMTDETGKKYFGQLLDEDGKYNGVCADVFDHYKLKHLDTTYGSLECRYKLYGSCRSQLMYREARDLGNLHPVYNTSTNETVYVITEETLDWIEREGIDRIPARVMLDCECHNGICAHCYGLKYSNLQLPEIGDAVGTESAQAIGEPSAQLTLNVINKGGVAGASIASGIDVFTAYLNGSVVGGAKGRVADVPRRSGHVHISKMDNTVSVAVEPIDKGCVMCMECMAKAGGGKPICPLEAHSSEMDAACRVPARVQQNALAVKDGEWIESGYPLTNYTLVSDSIVSVKDSEDPRAVLRHKQMVWINNYYNVFKDQSISINVRHFELLAMVQNQYVTVTASENPEFKTGNVYNVADIDLNNSDIQYVMKTLPMEEVILRNSGLLASLTFGNQMSVISNATVRNYHSDFNTNTSPLGYITVGQDLNTKEMKKLENRDGVEAVTVEPAEEGQPEIIDLGMPSSGIQLNEMGAFDFGDLEMDFGFEKPEVEVGTLPTGVTDAGTADLDVFGSLSRDSEDNGAKDLFGYSVHYFFSGKHDASMDEEGYEFVGTVIRPRDCPEGYELVGNREVALKKDGEVINFLYRKLEDAQGHSENPETLHGTEVTAVKPEGSKPSGTSSMSLF